MTEITDYRALFSDYCEGLLSKEEQEQMKAALEIDNKLASELEEFKKVLTVEKSIAKEEYELNASFEARVMDQIDADQGFLMNTLRRFYMQIQAQRRLVLSGVATLAVMAVVIQLSFDSPDYHQYRATKQKATKSALSIPEPLLDEASEMKSDKNLSAGISARTESGEGIAPVAPKVMEEEASVPAKKPSSKVMGLTGEALGKKELSASVVTPQAGSVDSLAGAPAKSYSNVQPPITADMDMSYRQSEKSVNMGSPTAVGKRKGAAVGRIRSGGQEYEVDSSGQLRAVVPSESKQNAAGYRGNSAPLADMIARGTNEQGTNAQGINAPTAIAPYQRRHLWSNNDYAATKPNRELYASSVENSRISTKDETKSTFSIDVDTGSYTNVRRTLRSGVLPNPDSVRIEEFINYFDYNYPEQGKLPFTLSYEIAPAPFESGRHLLKLGIKAKSADTEKPWNLVFLVDVSGSMSSNDKLPLVQRALRVLVNNMRDGDRISLVTYAGNSAVRIRNAGMNRKDEIIREIDMLSSGGSTHGSQGIRTAYDIAEQTKINGGVNRVVLVTDGDFNVGMYNRSDLINYIEQRRNSGVALTTIGVGTGNLNEHLIEQLSNKGNGNYFYLDSFQEARKVFQQDLAGTMETVAKDVKLQIEFNPEIVAGYRLVGYENRKLRNQDFHNDKIDAGEIGSGHTVTALYEVTLVDSPKASELNGEYRYKKQKKVVSKPLEQFADELAFLQLRYKQPEGNVSKLISYPIEKKDIQSSVEKASDDFRFATAVSYFGHLLRNSQFVGEYTFKDVAELAKGALGEDKEGYRRELIRLIDDADSLKKNGVRQPTPWERMR